MLSSGIDIWRGTDPPPAAGGVISANRQLWLRKATAAGASWPDASGNSRNLALTGSPTIGATSVTFNGTSQYGTVAFTIGAPCTIYLRMKQVSWTGDDYFCSGTTGKENSIYQSADGASPELSLNNSAQDGNGATSSGLAVGSMGNVCAAFNAGTTCSINVNGTTVSGSLPSGTDAVMGGFVLAAANNAGLSPSNIEVVEVVMYSVAHDASQQSQMITYLGTL